MMRSRFPLHVFVFVFATLLLISACVTGDKKADKNPATDAPRKQQAQKDQLDGFGTRSLSTFLPLNLGNTWVYRRSFLGETGQLTVTIEKKDEQGFYVDSQGGRFKITSLGIRDDNRFLIIPPTEKGTRWQAQVAPNIAEHFEITEDNQTVTVPAGSYEHCLVVQSTTRLDANTRMVITVTYAPKVGIIRSETRMENNQRRVANQVVLELESYQFP